MNEARAIAADEAKLIDALTARTDCVRRTWLFTFSMSLLLLSFALMPLLPGAQLVLGALLPWQVALVVLPALVFIFGATLTYRRFGSATRAYVVLEALEVTCLCSSTLAIPVLDAQATPLFWVLAVPTGVFWGLVKPGFGLRYGGMIAVASVANVAALLVQGRVPEAGLALGVGVTTEVALAVTIRARFRAVRAEAERNVLRARVAEARLEQSRRQTEQELTQDVGGHLEALAVALEQAGRDEAREVRRMVEMVSDIVFPLEQSLTLGELAKLIGSRCQQLCGDLALEFDAGASAHPLGARPARALLRIAQELVRNAVTHGTARAVRVELALTGSRVRLRVSDDGVGLTPTAFSGATGGLRNARAWIEEMGGGLAVEAQPGWATSLAATLP